MCSSDLCVGDHVGNAALPSAMQAKTENIAQDIVATGDPAEHVVMLGTEGGGVVSCVAGCFSHIRSPAGHGRPNGNRISWRQLDRRTDGGCLEDTVEQNQMA